MMTLDPVTDSRMKTAANAKEAFAFESLHSLFECMDITDCFPFERFAFDALELEPCS
jgi:hypothetical protein